jgi:hypothetical protein
MHVNVRERHAHLLFSFEQLNHHKLHLMLSPALLTNNKPNQSAVKIILIQRNYQ